MKKNEMIKEAYEICDKFKLMLENAPQGMSNVTLILNALSAAKKLKEYLEN